MELYIKREVGTVYREQWALNPLLLVLAMCWEQQGKAIAELFGLIPSGDRKEQAMTEPKIPETGLYETLTERTIKAIILKYCSPETRGNDIFIDPWVYDIVQAQCDATLDEVREKVEGLELVAPIPLGPLFGVGWSACLKAVKAKLEKVKE